MANIAIMNALAGAASGYLQGVDTYRAQQRQSMMDSFTMGQAREEMALKRSAAKATEKYQGATLQLQQDQLAATKDASDALAKYRDATLKETAAERERRAQESIVKQGQEIAKAQMLHQQNMAKLNKEAEKNAVDAEVSSVLVSAQKGLDVVNAHVKNIGSEILGLGLLDDKGKPITTESGVRDYLSLTQSTPLKGGKMSVDEKTKIERAKALLGKIGDLKQANIAATLQYQAAQDVKEMSKGSTDPTKVRHLFDILVRDRVNSYKDMNTPRPPSETAGDILQNF